MAYSHLFQPLTLRGLTLKNRALIAPMCQYSAADDGVPTDWHLAHLGSFATGGFSLVLAEASGVTPAGRISPGDLGLWSDDQVSAFSRIADFVHENGQGAAFGIQLAHAGRKASTYHALPGYPEGSLASEDGAWETFAPTDEPFGPFDAPRAMTEDDILETAQAFADAARRAVQAGVDTVQIHAAHGYLLHEFLQKAVNTRDDRWGGEELENRMRFPLEVIRRVRAELPDEMPLLLRVSAVDWKEEWGTDAGRRANDDDLAEITEFVRQAGELGVDMVDVSSGGNLPQPHVKPGPGYQTEFAAHIRKETGIVTSAVGVITDPTQAEHIVASGQADAVSIGREALRDPRWAWRAARELRQDIESPGQFYRAAR
ncbi:NADH:flavin oxidoreductase/NADH oxidase [Kocuria massiliensis]|uniref:NADH:flavin oxidoreductase/NADH oxidase n=1 Tax=Kocuria massiliensis TaxID=1926282 RepID=UPI000A1C9429|nr:NADH:flavin oxidoreductase/NADH oxidase [Kocuria massiliensis]